MILDKQGFDSAVLEISELHGFKLCQELEEAVATVILHAPPDMGDFNQEYIANRVAKMLANKIAYEKIQEIKVARDTKQAETTSEVPANGTVSVQD